jgi:hypothetical protein
MAPLPIDRNGSRVASLADDDVHGSGLRDSPAAVVLAREGGGSQVAYARSRTPRALCASSALAGKETCVVIRWSRLAGELFAPVLQSACAMRGSHMPRGAVIPAPKIAAWAISDDHFSVMPIRWQQRADAESARALPSV